MDIIEAQKIVNLYGKLIEEIGKRSATHYPLMKYPKSLLFCDHEKIREAINLFIKTQNDKNTVDALKTTLFLLDNFIDDEEAYILNNKLLSAHGYWEGLRKRGTI